MTYSPNGCLPCMHIKTSMHALYKPPGNLQVHAMQTYGGLQNESAGRLARRSHSSTSLHRRRAAPCSMEETTPILGEELSKAVSLDDFMVHGLVGEGEFGKVMS